MSFSTTCSLIAEGIAQRARIGSGWADRLRGRLTGIAVELWDERLTTAEAQRKMIAGGARRERRKEKVDSMAAALLLSFFVVGFRFFSSRARERSSRTIFEWILVRVFFVGMCATCGLFLFVLWVDLLAPWLGGISGS